MISTLQGELIARQEASVIVEVAGVGFEVFMSMRDMTSLPQAGSRIRILTKLMVRDDAMVLYGFSSSEGKRVFEKLIGVSGVGPKVALAILSTYAPSDIVAHVVGQDAAAIQRVPGVGKKMASRIILELKYSFGGESVSSAPTQT
ncbi:MAG: Holliday junction branch migration protein RuvA, partial [Coriobacteriia bacterium]|nr:Holliday junction branch migration protein RuvA [Coriobacteriia bacterium]